MSKINLTDKKLKGTKTEKNLWEAVRAEAAARAKYDAFADAAQKEGYVAVCEVFRKTAQNEQAYRELAANITLGDAFDKSKPVLWKCENCGYVSLAACAPEVCPACSSPQGFFRERKESLR